MNHLHYEYSCTTWCWRRCRRIRDWNDSHQYDTADGSNGFRGLDEFCHIRLAKSIAGDSSGITTRVVDVAEVEFVYGRKSLATVARGQVDVAGAMVEHPNSGSDTKFTGSTDQEVCLARIEQLGSWINTNGLWASARP